MFRKSFFLLLIMLFCVMMANIVIAQKECTQDGNKPACAYEALNVGRFKPTIDGNLNDWKLVKEGVFLGKDFWEANGENYKGEDDLSATWWVLWDEDNLYVAFSVKDDVHQNTKAGDAIYAGDGPQISIDPTGKKVVHGGNVYEYGYALAGAKGKEKPTVWRWYTNAASKGEHSEYMILRDEATKTTTYEIRIPKGDIAPAELSAGKSIGWSIVVNDSDSCDCQGGWVGWASRAIVFGKQATPMADLKFSKEELAVSPQGKLAAIWGEMKRMD
jgi:hypothetical protein